MGGGGEDDHRRDAETQRRRRSQKGDEKGTDERRDAEEEGALQSGDEGTRDGKLTTERTERTERGREKDGTDRSPGPSPTRGGMPRQRRSGRRGGHRPLSESPLPFRGGAGGEVNTRLANLYPTSPHPHYGYPHLSFLLPSSLLLSSSPVSSLCPLCALWLNFVALFALVSAVIPRPVSPGRSPGGWCRPSPI